MQPAQTHLLLLWFLPLALVLLLPGCVDKEETLSIKKAEASYGYSSSHGGTYVRVNVTLRNEGRTLGEYSVLVKADLLEEGEVVGTDSYENLEKIPAGEKRIALYIDGVRSTIDRTVVVHLRLSGEEVDRATVPVSAP